MPTDQESDDRFLAGHKFSRPRSGPARRCLRCGAQVAGGTVFGWWIVDDPAGRTDGPHHNPPSCAKHVEVLKPSALN